MAEKKITSQAAQALLDAEVRAIADPAQRAVQLRALMQDTDPADHDRRVRLAQEVRAALKKSPGDDPATSGLADESAHIEVAARMDQLTAAATEAAAQAAAKGLVDAIPLLSEPVDRVRRYAELAQRLRRREAP